MSWLPICTKCGSRPGQEREAYIGWFRYWASADVCAECWRALLKGHAAWKHEFEVLLDRGVSREEANLQIIERMDGGSP